MLFKKGQVIGCFDMSGSSAVKSAVSDLAADFYDVLGIKLVPADRENALLIIGDKPEESGEGFESHSITEKDGKLFFSGSDERGIMWAIYTFCDEYLGVFPLYFWSDTKKPKLDELIFDRDYRSEPFAFKYRGWFLNDEDLLTGFEKTGKRRDTAYVFYHTVVSDRLINKAVESALRSKLNLIIPASLMNIGNPDERTLVDICAERGMYITQHHIEPLGVSSFTWDFYWEQKGGEIPKQSFVENPDKYVEIWEHYAGLWSKYPNVIWQLGLRGRGDRPVWMLDPSVPQDDSGRGELISRAIQTQYDIVAKKLGSTGFVSTSTLWMECGPMMEKGYMTIPDGTIIVYSDVGYTQNFGGDLDICDGGSKKGIYYHAAFITAGPHLVRGNSPERMQRNINYAIEKGCSEYAILNVSNIREFVENITFFTQITRAGQTLDRKAALSDYAERVYADRSLGELIERFYEVYPSIPNGAVLLDGIADNAARQLIAYCCNPVNQLRILYITDIYGMNPIEAAKHISGYYSRGIEALRKFFAEPLKYPGRDYLNLFRSQFEYQPAMLLEFYLWGYEVCEYIISGDKQNITAAFEHISRLEAVMKQNSYPNEESYLSNWKNWYNECLKVSPEKMRQSTEKLGTIDREKILS